MRLCSDEWMSDLSIDSYDPAARAAVDALQQHMAIRLAKAGRCAIYESGGWTRAERDELLLRTRTVQGLISLQYLDLPVDKLWQRVQLRNAQLPYATALRDGAKRARTSPVLGAQSFEARRVQAVDRDVFDASVTPQLCDRLR